MANFTTHSLDTVAEAGRETLDKVNNSYGFVPNLLGTMIESPETAKGYLALGELFAQTSFDEVERQVIYLTVSRVNNCEYCVAAHSAVSHMHKLPADVIEAIRNDEPIADHKLEALRRFVVALIEHRGWVPEEALGEFFAAGYGERQVFEAILGPSMKTISNYVNHLASTELDVPFAAHAWQAPKSEVA